MTARVPSSISTTLSGRRYSPSLPRREVSFHTADGFRGNQPLSSTEAIREESSSSTDSSSPCGSSPASTAPCTAAGSSEGLTMEESMSCRIMPLRRTEALRAASESSEKKSPESQLKLRRSPRGQDLYSRGYSTFSDGSSFLSKRGMDPYFLSPPPAKEKSSSEKLADSEARARILSGFSGISPRRRITEEARVKAT